MSERHSVFDTSSGASRRDQFLNLASELFAQRGYHNVSIDDIGAAVGVTGPALYRHFSSKAALLAALFEKLTGELVARAAAIAKTESDAEEALRQLVRYQAEMCVYDRSVMAVYLSEFRSLPEADQQALRLKQRPYLFDWMRILGRFAPSSTEAELRALVHAAIGVAQSVVYYQSPLDDEQLIEIVAAAAERVLGLPESTGERRVDARKSSAVV